MLYSWVEASLVNLFSIIFGRFLLYTLYINFANYANSYLYISSSLKKLRFLYNDVTGVRMLLKVMALRFDLIYFKLL